MTIQMSGSPCELSGVTEEQLTRGTYKREPLQFWFGGEAPGPVGMKVHGKIEGPASLWDDRILALEVEPGSVFEFDATIVKVEDGRWMVEEVTSDEGAAE